MAHSLTTLVLLLPTIAVALTSPNLRDLADPVSPGGVLPYRITLSDQTPEGPPPPYCFNPPAECVTVPVTCSNPAPSCVGDEISGFVCQNAVNDGADCGTGTPPVADPQLCIAHTQGVCSGGPNNGLPCTAPDGGFTTQCPGFTFVCERAVNQGDYCGTSTPPEPQCIGDPTNGFFCVDAENEAAPCGVNEADPSLCQPMTNPPPRPENSFCLSHPTGICSGGPNFGLTCDAPHGEPSDQCPADAGPAPTPSNITVELPILPGMTFIDADNGGTSDGTRVQWTVPPLSSCGVPGTPTCPRLNARLLIDPLVPEGTVFQNQATASDQDGFQVSNTQRTTVARFRLRTLTLAYPLRGDGHEGLAYRTLFSLLATESIDPANEVFNIHIANIDGTIADFTLPAGQLSPTSASAVAYRGVRPGLIAVVVRQLTPGFYSLRVRGAGLDLPDITSLNVTVTLTFGDDVLSHDVRLAVKRGGRRYVATKSTTTTTIVSSPTTTTSTTLP
jgi:hypothetical protein